MQSMYLSGSDGDIISHHCPHGFLPQATAGTGNDITISLIPDNICIGEKKNTSLQSSPAQGQPEEKRRVCAKQREHPMSICL